MSYATPDNMLARYDVRRLGELVRDNNSRATETELVTDAILGAALDDASGMIEAAALAGGRYSIDDLEGFTDNAQRLLIRLTCDLAYGLLVQRRGFSAADQQTLAPGFQQALALLKRIEDGGWVFPTAAAAAASKPRRVQLSTYPTMTTTEAARHFAAKTNPNGSTAP